MAFVFDTNNTPATGAEVLYLLKELLKTAGWTVPRSSDGSTYNSSGDQITTAASGAGGMANNSAWFVLQAPAAVAGSTRRFLFQRGTNNRDWLCYYATTAFTGGTPSATERSTAADEEAVNGGGTPAAPTFDTILGVDGAYRFHAGADNATPYSFYAVTPTIGTGVATWAFLFDALKTGTYPSADVDPYVMYSPVGGGAETLTGSSSLYTESATTGVKGWLAKGLGGADFVNIPVVVLYSVPGATMVVPDSLGSNPHTGLDDVVPVHYARRTGLAAPVGWKGASSLLRWTGVSRSPGDTLTVDATRDRVIFGQVSLPWDGSVPTV